MAKIRVKLGFAVIGFSTTFELSVKFARYLDNSIIVVDAKSIFTLSMMKAFWCLLSFGVLSMIGCKDDPIVVDPIVDDTIVSEPEPNCGCTDTSAFNYDSTVACMDSTCVFASDIIVGSYAGKRQTVFVQGGLPSLGALVTDTMTIIKLDSSHAQINGFQSAVLTILPVKFEDYVKYTFLNNGAIYPGGFLKDDSLNFDTPAEFSSWGITWYHFKGRRIQ